MLPIMHWALFSVFPWGLAHRLKSPLVSMGVGQFMLFSRSGYFGAGGFQAVRSDPVDDVALARLTKSRGLRWRFVDLSGRVRCRMYRGFRGAVDGLGKSTFPALGNKIWVLVTVLTLLGWLYLGPFSTGISRLLGFSTGTAALLWSGSAFALALLGWVFVLRRFEYPWYLAFLFPVTIGIVMGMSVRSAFQFWRGEAKWKGRTLPGLSGEGTGEDLERRQSPADR